MNNVRNFGFRAIASARPSGEGGSCPFTEKPASHWRAVIRDEPLQHHEIQEVAYQMAARLNSNAIADPDERRRLKDMNETIHQTRLALKHGRGNVRKDLEPSGYQNLIGTTLSYFPDEVDGGKIRTEQSEMFAKVAGAALALGAGNCDQHATIVARRHGLKLAGKEEDVYRVESDVPPPGHATGHVWCEVHAPAKDGAKPAPIVGDSWSNGPAARLQDTLWESDRQFAKAYCLQKEYPESVFGCLERTYEALGPGGSRRGSVVAKAREMRVFMLQNVKMVEEDVVAHCGGPEVQVIAQSFAEGARNELEKMPKLTQEVWATAAAREAYDVSIREATRSAKAVIREAGRLDRQDRPPVTTPDFFLEDWLPWRHGV